MIIRLARQKIFLAWLMPLLLAGCDDFTDAATRLAYDIEKAAKHLKQNGDRYTLRHNTPSETGECEGPYKVQFDKVGALIVWCYSAAGAVVSSHSTSYHARFVNIAETRILEKAAGETLTVELEKRGSRTVIVEVR